MLTPPFAAALLAVAASAQPAGDRLTLRETEALRDATYRAAPGRLAADLAAAVRAELEAASPPLTVAEIDLIVDHVRRHSPIRQRVGQLALVRVGWRRLDSGPFVFWWDPQARGLTGLPSRAPTPEEVVELESLARRTSERFGVTMPHGLPIRVDASRRGSRCFPRDDLRWGIATARALDREALVRVMLMELGRVPYLLEPLSVLHGACAGDVECRREVLAQARSNVVASGHVGILEGLRAGSLSAPDDPALGSALLMVDHLERTKGVGVVGRLLTDLRTGAGPGENRRVIWAVTATTPRRLDGNVRRGLRRWAQQAYR